MIDEEFIKFVEEGSKAIVKMAEQLPIQMEKMKGQVSPEEYKKVQDAITVSDIKWKLNEFQNIKKNLDNALKKYQ